MAWGIVPDIKDEKVVCQNPCEHRDCAANRKQWERAICHFCKKPLLPGEKFCFGDNNVPEHFWCAMEDAEQPKTMFGPQKSALSGDQSCVSKQ